MTAVNLEKAEAETILYWLEARRKSCAGVLTEDYLRQFPVANTPENLDARRAELAHLDGLIEKLKAVK